MTRSNADERDAASVANGADVKPIAGRVSGVSSKAVPPPLPPHVVAAAAASSNAATRQSGTQPAGTPAAPDPQAPASQRASSLTAYSRVGRRSTPGMPAVAVSPVVAVQGSTPHSRPSISQDALNIAPPVAHPASSRGLPAAPRVAPPPVPRAAPAIEEEPTPPTERHVPPPPKSVRPPAPDPFVAKDETESIAQTFDRLLGHEVDSSFAAMKVDTDVRMQTIPDGVQAVDLSEVRNLFEQLAANHVRQVRDFIIDLKWAEASRDWIGICEPAVRSLRRGAEKLELVELRNALDAFHEALAAAAAEGVPILEGPARDRILASYDHLVELLPKAFALDMDRTQRESAIVQSLLLQIPDVRKVTIDKLYAAGLNSLATLAIARADEVAAASGIALRVAERVVEKFQGYREELQKTSPDATRAHERSSIESLVAELAREHEAFERVSSAWTQDATEEKKRLRRARHKTLMQINVLLARLGEVGRLNEIERLPFERKLEQLRAYLRDAQEKYVAAI